MFAQSPPSPDRNARAWVSHSPSHGREISDKGQYVELDRHPSADQLRVGAATGEIAGGERYDGRQRVATFAVHERTRRRLGSGE